MDTEAEKELFREIAQKLINAVIEEMVSQGVKIIANEVKRRAVTMPSGQDDGAEGRGYNKALIDCAAAIDAAGVAIENDPRIEK